MFFIFDDTKEPEDIFSESSPTPAKEGAPAAPGDLPTPGIVPAKPAAPEKGTTPLPVGETGVIIERSAFGKKFVIIGIVGALILIVAGWFFLFRNKGASIEVVGLDEITAPAEGESPSSPPPPAVEETTAATEPSDGTEGEPSPPPPGEETSEPAEPSPPPPGGEGAVIDTDGDGLSDSEEVQLGTDPAKVDTDDDGLSDREEVKTYNTDPNDPDTDGDTYKDGEEVQNGFDPNGPGRLLQIPQ